MLRRFWVLGLCLLPFYSFSQSDSATNQTRTWVTIGKVWGFLKYYHPQVATRKINWDAQLIRFVEELPPAQTKEDLSARLLAWINQLGPVEPCLRCSHPDSTNLTYNIDLSWLADSSLFSLPLRQTLTYIAANRNQQANQYLRWNPFRNRLEFSESNYSVMALPSPSYRLLGLFRYWNIIEYFHPTKYAFSRNWNQVLTEFVPLFQQAADTLSYQRVLRQLISTIQDGHAELMIPVSHRLSLIESSLYPSFDYRLVGDTLLVTGSFNDSLSQRDDVRRGDRIISVEGQSVEQLIDQRGQYITASNQSAKIRQILPFLLTGSQHLIQIELMRDGQRIKKQIHRYQFQQFGYQSIAISGSRSKEVPTTIGYINLGELAVSDVKRVMNQYRSKKGIIFDARTYPKGTFQRLSDYLNPHATGFARYTKPDLTFPGSFKVSPIHSVGRTNADYYRGKVAILSNSYTQSAAESTCMALRTAPQAKIIGSQSAGANGDVCYVSFPGGYQTLFTGTGVYTPDMRLIQGQGVPIDIEAKPGCEDILSGKDRALQTAIDWISQ